jgi:hypothetical protein
VTDRPNIYPGQLLQMSAHARFSDGSTSEVTDQAAWETSDTTVATISAKGILTALQEGNVEVRATYQGVAGAAAIRVVRPPRTGPPGPDEVIGRIHEIAPFDDVRVTYARVEVAGGEQNGRFVIADSSGEFRIDGIDRAGFDLLISKPGYRDARYRVHQLPRDASAKIGLEPAPPLVSEAFQGTLCDALTSATRTKSTFFTPRVNGIFRMTSYRIDLFERGPVTLSVNGTKIPDPIPEPPHWLTDFSLQAGTTYEVRVSGHCFGPGLGTFQVTYLRPR